MQRPAIRREHRRGPLRYENVEHHGIGNRNLLHARAGKHGTVAKTTDLENHERISDMLAGDFEDAIGDNAWLTSSAARTTLGALDMSFVLTPHHVERPRRRR